MSERTRPVTGAAAAAAAFAFVYLYAFPYFGRLRSANELPRVLMTQEIVERGTFAVDARLPEMGSLYDIATAPDGRHYPNKAPGVSVLAVPVSAERTGRAGRIGSGSVCRPAQARPGTRTKASQETGRDDMREAGE